MVRISKIENIFSFVNENLADVENKKYHTPVACALTERSETRTNVASPHLFCAVGGLTDFAFACLLQKQIELNVG